MLYVYEIPIKAGGTPAIPQANMENLIDYVVAGSGNFGFGIFTKMVSARYCFQVKNDNRKKEKKKEINVNAKRLSNWSIDFVMFFFEAHYSNKRNLNNYYKVFEPMYKKIQKPIKVKNEIYAQNNPVTIID